MTTKQRAVPAAKHISVWNKQVKAMIKEHESRPGVAEQVFTVACLVSLCDYAMSAGLKIDRDLCRIAIDHTKKWYEAIGALNKPSELEANG